MANSTNSIIEFKKNFNGGTRSNRFEVISSGGWPSGVPVDISNTPFKIYSTSMPKAEVGTITVGYRGRPFNVAGDRSYTTWQINVYDDRDTKNLWRSFNTWKELLDGHVNHQVANSDFAYKNLQKTWVLNQLNLNGNILRTLTLKNCWPGQVGGILFDSSSSTQCSFAVTMIFDWYEITKGI